MFEALLGSLLFAAPQSPPSASCPEDMRLVVGEHVADVQRWCVDHHHGQCWGYYPGAVALEGERRPVRVCMDTFEWPNRRGAEPLVMASYLDAEKACAAIGKRLCTEAEWEVACEGPERLPWPYGHVHEPARCHNERRYRGHDERKLASRDPEVRRREAERLWQGEVSGARPGCTSPFGVVDLVGNVEEWVTTTRPEWPYVSSLKGGYWAKAWSGCRGTNDSHGPLFRFYETGFRCCREPDPPAPASALPLERSVVERSVLEPRVLAALGLDPSHARPELVVGDAPFDAARVGWQRR